jgi:hypothetical protein
MERNDRALIEIQYRRLPGPTEEIHENPQSRELVCRLKFEPRT